MGLFLLSVLRYLLGNDSAWMFCVPYRCTSMLEIIPEDDEEVYDEEDTKSINKSNNILSIDYLLLINDCLLLGIKLAVL